MVDVRKNCNKKRKKVSKTTEMNTVGKNDVEFIHAREGGGAGRMP